MEEKLTKYFLKEWKQESGKVRQPVSSEQHNLTMKFGAFLCDLLLAIVCVSQLGKHSPAAFMLFSHLAWQKMLAHAVLFWQCSSASREDRRGSYLWCSASKYSSTLKMVDSFGTFVSLYIHFLTTVLDKLVFILVLLSAVWHFILVLLPPPFLIISCCGTSERKARHLYYSDLRERVLRSECRQQEEVYFQLAGYAMQADLGDQPLIKDNMVVTPYFEPKQYFPPWVGVAVQQI